MTSGGDNTVILLARHGETLWNQQKRLQGQNNSPLTAAGEAQARSIGGMLQNVSIDAAYVSPLQRAVDTIRIILQGRELEPLESPRLMEVALGPWEGKYKDDTRRSHAREYHDFWHRPERFSLTGAETYADLQKRVVGQLQDIFERHKGQIVLVLSQPDIAAYRAFQMIQDKARPAGNGEPFSRAATQDWIIWKAPYGRAVEQSLAALRLLTRTGPLPASRALRSTTPRHAVYGNIRLREY